MMDELSEAKKLHSNVAAEYEVIGSILIDASCIESFADLTPEDFEIDRNRDIYAAMLSLKNSGESYDQIAVIVEHMKDLGTFVAEGGTTPGTQEYLFEILRSTPTAACASDRAKTVIENSCHRKIIECESDTTIGKRVKNRTLKELQKRLDSIETGGDSIWNDFFSVCNLTDDEKKPPEFIVSNLIPCGVTFISGAPKTRKSFMALQLSAAVCSGEKFLGFDTTKCGVCYFDLEGSKSRISSRADAMNIVNDLHNVLVTNSTKVTLAGDGRNSTSNLADYIRMLHRSRPNFRLFIVDTYSRARGSFKAMGANAYDADVQLLQPVQKMALEEKVAVVFIHHFRKGAGVSPDSFEKLSGTMGISGSADSVITLDADGGRSECKAHIEYVPRDGEPGKMAIEFNQTTMKWDRIDEDPHPLLGNPITRSIIELRPEDIKDHGTFISYEALYKKAYYGASKENCGTEIRNEIMKYMDDLFLEYGIAVQLGVKNNTDRGIRIITCKKK